MTLFRRILRNRAATILFALNLCFFVYGASGWWRESRIATDCDSVAQARLSDAADCHFMLSTGFMIGGFFYVLPDTLNRVTIVPLVHSFSSMCNCTAFRLELAGILGYSSLQAIILGYGIDRLIKLKRGA